MVYDSSTCITSIISWNYNQPRTERSQQQKWIVVDYIQKPFYDDHFDIERESLKLGKSLKMVNGGFNIG